MFSSVASFHIVNRRTFEEQGTGFKLFIGLAFSLLYQTTFTSYYCMDVEVPP